MSDPLPAPPIVLERDFPEPDRDPHFIAESLDEGRHAIRHRIPAHYRWVIADHQQVIGWIHAVVAAVAANRGGVPVLKHGPSLAIVGPTGTGKTHQALGAVQALLLSGVALRWEMVSMADLLGKLRPRPKSSSEEEFDRFANVPLLMLDDLGTAKGSEWAEETTGRLIDHRYIHDLPTVVTSNVPPHKFSEVLGERVASRLSEMCRVVTLDGPDRRRGGES